MITSSDSAGGMSRRVSPPAPRTVKRPFLIEMFGGCGAVSPPVNLSASAGFGADK
jgi:hypothetical protein